MNHSTFVSPSTGRKVKAILFDTFGTVVDWRTGVAREARMFADKHGLTMEPFDLADTWRARYYPSMAPIRSGDRGYVPLDQLHFENLKTALAELGLPPSEFPDDDLLELTRAWERLPAWPDSVEGLKRMKARYIVGPLSNANTALLVSMAKSAGLPWDVVIGMDLLQVYKPDPAAYTGAAALLRLHPGEIMLAAAHNYDLQAARETGMATAFVRRATEHGPEQTTDLAPASDWDICVEDFTQLAQSLSAEPAATA
ncbi:MULTISPECIES: haloacid dehalogenase type II [Arthrobacter]|uniref:Haloacid dehalogenase type II n=1 Tax=Arthrobacter terricola TaxID=2547396 RepID=A0A4R5KA01_9MICC|nr:MULTISPECIES: haloacid dehalogenase type II [Arthrobacter]MBT8163462.1 haloacid dehalogenase type II [Arthrobacter sp. GN70]TDF89764.1 haloacid dehalogenase type II [Arthrobacter terricola]